MRCQECDDRVSLGVIDTEQKTKTKKSYGDSVKTIGERVNVRLGLVCDCTTWSDHTLRYKGLDQGHFEVKPEKFPSHWIETVK